MDTTPIANHVLESILRDLAFLKDNSFIESKTYNDVITLLPSHIQKKTADMPPLPTRKSINSNQPRDLPKLPVRRTPDWQNGQTQIRSITHSEPEKSIPLSSSPAPAPAPAPAPPAYTTHQDTVLTTAEALYDYDGEDPSTDLSFKQGDLIEVTEYVNDDWWKGKTHGKTGIFPQNHVKKIAPAIKPKKPWVPSFSAKPVVQHSPSPSYTPDTSNMPYHYPPPPQAMYQPPPVPVQNYGQPSTVIVNNVGTSEEEHGGDKKVANMAKKFGGNIATAATWGFGATLGSQAANAIF